MESGEVATPAGEDGVVAKDRRTDPEDGLVYSMDELRIKYRGVYDEAELEGYFHTKCLEQDDSETDSPEDSKKVGDDLQQKGKDEYNKGNYEEAIKAWTTSLKSVAYIIDKGFYKDNPDQAEEVRQINLRLLLNLSQGSLKLEDWRKAIEFANKVLELDKNHTKALYRKSVALIEMGEFKDGTAALDALLRIEPDNPAAKALQAKANRSAIEAHRKSQKAAKRMFANLEADSRVPPTRIQWLIDSIRNGPQEVSLLMEDWRWRVFDMRRDILRQAQAIARSLLGWCRQRCKGFVQSMHETVAPEKDANRSKEE